MNDPIKYLLDANVFIQAKRTYYPFDICPGYWEALCWHKTQETIFSIDKVWSELKKGGDDLFTWATETFLEDGFIDSSIASANYSTILQWVQNHSQFSVAAKSDFADVADGWLVALAKTKGYVLVTQEVINPSIKRKVPIPNVCDAFGVKHISTYDLLRDLGIVLNWQSPS